MKFGKNNQGAAKLTVQQVQWARESYAIGGVTHRELAEYLGVSTVQMGRILRQECWEELPPTTAMMRNEIEVSQEKLLEDLKAHGFEVGKKEVIAGDWGVKNAVDPAIAEKVKFLKGE